MSRRQHFTPRRWGRRSSPRVSANRRGPGRGRVRHAAELPLRVRSLVRMCQRTSSCAQSPRRSPPVLPVRQQIAGLARVRRQVEEQGRQEVGLGRELHVLVPRAAPDLKGTVAHRDAERPLRQLIGRVGEAPFVVGRGAPVLRRGLTAEERIQRPAVGLQRYFRSEEVTDRWQHVHRLRHCVDDPAAAALRLRPRVHDDQGHVVALVPVAQFLEQPVIATHLAVVAGDDHHRRCRQAGLVEVLEERSQAVVDFALGPVVGRPQLPPFPLVGGRAHAGDLHRDRTQRVDGGLVLPARAAGEFSDRVGRIEVVVADRVAARWMGTDERGVHEERGVAVVLEPVHDLAADEGGLRQFGREAGRRPGRAVRVGSGKPLERLVELMRVRGHVDAAGRQPATPGRTPLLPRVHDEGAEAGEDALVGEQPGVIRGHGARVDRGVGVPEEHGVIAELPCHQRDVGESGVERCAVQDGAVPMEIRARVEAGARRSAGRGIGPVVGEEDTACRQGVQGRRLEHGMVERREAVAAPLIERDEQDVAGIGHVATLVDGVPAHPHRPTDCLLARRRARRATLSSTCAPSLPRAWCRTR